MIDINCDMGELNELMDDGTYESLMDHVTSINVACGGHAGDDVMMNTMVKLAKDKKVNSSSLVGYYADVKFVNNTSRKAELFSVGSEISESSR